MWSDSIFSQIPSVTALCAGTYSVTVTDVQANSAVGTVTITQPAPLVINSIPHNPTSPNSNDGYIELSASGGVPPYTYSWNDGENTANIYQLTIGIYNITVTDANGCISSLTINLIDNQSTTCQAYFSASPDSGQYYFNDQSVIDNGGYITTYFWDFGDGSSSTISTPVHPLGMGLHIICLTIATSNGCSSTYCDSIYVITNPCSLYANINAHSPTTIGGSDGYIETNVIGGIPNYSYSWSNNEVTPNIYNLPSGTYSLTVIDANGCQNSFYAPLYEPNDTLGGPIIDTLYTVTVDSCLNFVPDSFSIASISIDPNADTVNVVWIFINGGLTTTITASYAYTQSGNTMVILTINCGTKTLTTYQSYINITNTSSVPIYGAEQNLFIYPVPFSNKLNIDFTTQKSENVNILLIDASGRVLIINKIHALSGVNNTEINTSQLSSGIYILNIETSNGIVRKQIVK